MYLIEHRLRAQKSVLEVSRLLEVSPSAIYQWERGETRPAVENLKKLAKLYGCPADDLLKED